MLRPCRRRWLFPHWLHLFRECHLLIGLFALKGFDVGLLLLGVLGGLLGTHLGFVDE